MILLFRKPTFNWKRVGKVNGEVRLKNKHIWTDDKNDSDDGADNENGNNKLAFSFLGVLTILTVIFNDLQI